MRRPLYDTVGIVRPFEDVTRVIRRGPKAWLPDVVDETPAGWTVSLSAPGVLTAAVDTLVEVGARTETPGLLVVPIAWRAQHAEAAFPKLQAELEFEYLTPDATRLTLIGSYKPPLSVVGAAADRMLGHVVAEEVVRGFLEGIAQRIRDQVTDATPTLRA